MLEDKSEDLQKAHWNRVLKYKILQFLAGSLVQICNTSLSRSNMDIRKIAI